MENQLMLKFDPHTIEHLGIKMYSQLPYALAELVANAYDAGAENVAIKLYDKSSEKRIVISDDGEGMSFDDIGNKFLVIGRKRRETDEDRINTKGRFITGRKGLGKLALFGIGKTINIESTVKGENDWTKVTLDWDSIINETSGTYYPQVLINKKENVSIHGTKIELTNLSRASSFDLRATGISLSKLFNCFDDDFKVCISRNDEEEICLTKELRYEGMNKEFEWDIKDIVRQLPDHYERKNELRGYIVSTATPIRQELRGITLYANGRMANMPGFFGLSEAGHSFSYLSGWIEADFIDEFESDLISTDRQSLSWDEKEASELQKYLQRIVRFLVKDWSEKRKEAKNKKNSARSGVNTKEWFEKVPIEIKPKLENVINSIADKPEINDEDYSSVVRQIHDLLPPYTYFHYRLLHPEIQDASKKYYEQKDYYTAFQEAMKRYKNSVKEKSGVSATEDSDIVSKAFGKDETKPLKTTAKYKKRPNGADFSKTTLDNIEEGQMMISRGIVQGGRNVLSHEEHKDLMDTGLFSEKDCLDMLSILSHLFKRLDEAEKTNKE